MGKNESKYYLIYARYLHEEIKEYAELLKKLKKFEQIRAIYAKCIDLDNENKTKYYYLYARLFRDDYRNYKQSEVYYLKCLQMNANYDGCNGSYGHLLYLMGKYEESAKYLKIACNLDEKNIWTYYYYGLLMNQMNNLYESEQALDRALTMFKLNCSENYKNAHMLKENMKPHLEKTKFVDGKNIDYHDKFENAIAEFVESFRIKKNKYYIEC